MTVLGNELFLEVAIFEAVLTFDVFEDLFVDHLDQLVLEKPFPDLFVRVLKYAIVESYLILPK